MCIRDSGIRKKGQAVFSQITNYYTARAWAERTLNQSRAGRVLKMTVHYKYLYLVPNDIITFSYPRFGYSNTKFRVIEVEQAPTGLVNLSIEKFDPNGYTTSPQPEITNPSGSGGIKSPANLEFNLLPDPTIFIENKDPEVYGILHWDKSELTNVMTYSGHYYSGNDTSDRTYFEVAPGLEVGIGTGTPSEFKPYALIKNMNCLLYTSPSPRDGLLSRMPSSA